MSNGEKSTGKHTNLTPEEVKTYLFKFRKAIIDNKYTIEQNENRKENLDFIEDYKITTKRKRKYY